ncbi:uncharacterized protein [Henckelia pumila]|uniref:uncharacterized protein n=1 Tax=Henckelia pumila TaxID=405737 RepID=UPI003C6E5516
MSSTTGGHILGSFSHEHPLIFHDEENLDSDDVKPRCCTICGMMIFMGSYYICIEHCCEFIVHQQCTRLPPTVIVTGGDIYPDIFELRGPNDPATMNEKCLKCGQTFKNYYTYSSRLGHIHPLCGLKMFEMATKHRSHHEHPLVPTRREICGVCDACGEEERGFFLSCQTCDYWISQDCAILPPVAKHASHSHPLVRFYADFYISMPQRKFGTLDCGICECYIGLKSFYSCQGCGYFAHLKCIKSWMKNINTVEADWTRLIAELPPDKESAFSRFFPNLEQPYKDGTGTSIIRSRKEEIHEHPLILNHEVADNLEEGHRWESKLLCNACINPIDSSTSPYYTCSVAQCHFLVHDYCAKLPSISINSYFPSFLFTKFEEFFSVFYCDHCSYECNGFGYSLEGFHVDVECASVPRIIKHESHKNHYLHLTTSALDYDSDVLSCCIDDYNRFGNLYYRCTTCLSFKIHFRCAIMPRQVGHKFDKHLLRLITDGGNLVGLSMEYLENCGFCEFCEKPMDPSIWFYYCSECDHYFHVKCIPSVGKLSKMKFGGTLDLVGCHDHPVTSVRMLTVGNQSCTYCEEIIQGFQDDWAFHCESCNVWIHNACALKLATLSREKSGLELKFGKWKPESESV